MHELFLTKREEINYNETPLKSELNLSTSKEEDSICISGFSYPAKVDDGECWSHFQLICDNCIHVYAMYNRMRLQSIAIHFEYKCITTVGVPSQWKRCSTKCLNRIAHYDSDRQCLLH